jgi:hypothetical protein
MALGVLVFKLLIAFFIIASSIFCWLGDAEGLLAFICYFFKYAHVVLPVLPFRF